MSRTIQGRWAAAAALAATLMTATPVQAVSLGGWGDPSGIFLRAWQWVAGVGTKCGLHIDPNGLPLKAGRPDTDPSGSQGGGATPPASTASDSGIGADPNGG